MMYMEMGNRGASSKAMGRGEARYALYFGLPRHYYTVCEDIEYQKFYVGL